MPLNIKFSKSSGLFKKPGKYTSWKIFELLILGLLVGSIIWTVNFLYEYAYVTLDNAQAIVILNSGTSMDAIDSRSFNTAQAAVKLKNDLPNVDNKIRNIFYYGNETTSSSTKSGKK